MRLFFIATCCLVASPAFAQQTAPAAAPAGTAPAADAPAPEKPICRRIQVTGSNMAKRECHSRAEWKAIDAQQDPSSVRAFQNRPTGG